MKITFPDTVSIDSSIPQFHSGIAIKAYEGVNEVFIIERAFFNIFPEQ